MAALIDRHIPTARRGVWVIVAVGLLAAVPLSASAQIVSGQPTTARQGFTYLSWGLEGDSTDLTVKQWYIPIVVNAAIQDNWELSVFSSVASSDADWDLADDKISGLTDSRIQIAHSLADDRILLSGGVSLPTGQTELNADKRSLVHWITADFFTFPVKYHGEGFNFYGGAAGATPAGSWVLGLAGAMHVMGKYTPYEDGPEYTPGSRFILTGSAERQWASQGGINADVSMVVSGNDQSDGVDVFSDGTMFDVQLRGRRNFDVSQVDVALRAILRGKNDVLDPARAELVREEKNTNGSDVRVHVTGRRELTESLAAWLSLETRFLAANGYDQDSPFFEDAARITGFGGGVDFQLSERAMAGLGIRIWSGSADGAATYEALDLKGFELIQRLTLTM